ncbi:hypothetical protein [Streptomyces sp. RP5T]|uniref:hypothetical protein n=1 Tax=Streptomyces sp. RP5T TaxID=2490848 RepID=UPI000F64883D|nr:hypothetical protein [Streptomyces sp. RP5T]RRR86083.1 hypothetical protein EHS43_05740 [Streptomyces sp. RP5T]
MALFNARRGGRARLAPELDDKELGQVLKSLLQQGTPLAGDIRVWQISNLVQETGKDWDRRTHRFLVLARCAAETSLAALWLAHEPKNADAVLFRAWVQLVRANRTGVMPEVAEVVNDCYRVAESRPEDPGPWVVLLGVMRATRQPQRDVFRVWREVKARDPWHREAFLQMLRYLSPDECGSHLQVMEFLDAAQARMPANAPAAGLELTAKVHQYHKVLALGGLHELTAGSNWAQPPVAACLERARTLWVRPGFLQHAAAVADLNLLAYSLVAANRTSEAADAFRSVAGLVTHWPWYHRGDALEEFTRWRTRALQAASGS